MLKLVFPILAATLMAQSPAPATLRLGDPMPAFSLPRIDGMTLPSKLIGGPILVMFLSDRCPNVEASEKRINSLANKFASSIVFIGINSNDNGDARRHVEDLEGMKLHAKKAGYAFSYLRDESQEVARAFGVQSTPDFFLFNRGKLVYRGRLDDNSLKAEAATTKDLMNALSEVEAGRLPSPVQIPAEGCPITWKASH